MRHQWEVGGVLMGNCEASVGNHLGVCGVLIGNCKALVGMVSHYIP